jgi:hypothetical protein
MNTRMNIGATLIVQVALTCLASNGLCGKVEVQERKDYNETVYAMKDVPLKLIVYHGGNEGTVKLFSQSNEPVFEQVAAIEKLLAKALKDIKKPPTTLFVGTVYDSFGRRRDISERLVAAARTSPLWNARKRRAADGNDNRAVKAMLNEAKTYAELVDLFRKHRLVIEVQSVEKVRVNDEGLPFDAMVWFAVRPEERE